MKRKFPSPIELDPSGFNEIRMCRGGPMVYNKNDVWIGKSLPRYGEWSWLEQDLFRQIVRPGNVVVEAGANIGLHTVEFSRLVANSGAVFAFEPQRLVFQTLCANLALNQCSNVYALQHALGSSDGEILVPFLDPTASQNSGGVSLIGVQQGERVPVRTLDAFNLPACSFIKADVEGMEADVLAGAHRTIERFRPILYLENDRPQRSREVLAFVLSANYEAYWHLPPVYNPDNLAGDPENMFPNIVSVNVLCVPAEKGPKIEGFRRVLTPDDTWNAAASGFIASKV